MSATKVSRMATINPEQVKLLQSMGFAFLQLNEDLDSRGDPTQFAVWKLVTRGPMAMHTKVTFPVNIPASMEMVLQQIYYDGYHNGREGIKQDLKRILE